MDQPLTQIFQFLQDEYDIFGRKKKKKNRGPGAVSGPSGSNGREDTKKKQVKSYSLLMIMKRWDWLSHIFQSQYTLGSQ